MRSYINNGLIHDWNLSEGDLKKISARPNYKYEQYFNKIEEAQDTAKYRSMGTWKKVSVFSTKEGQFVVCSHNVEKVGWELVESWKRGEKIRFCDKKYL